jgi:ribokinase
MNMDLVATVKRLPNRGETVFGKDFAFFPGGKGANQAAAAGKLGAEVFLAACVGDDDFGRQLLQSMGDSKVETAYVRQVAQATGTAVITVDGAGANTIVVIPGANEQCEPALVDKILNRFAEPGILLVQNEVPANTVEHAIREAKLRGWTVIYNPAPVRELPTAVMPMIDVLLPNESELALLTGCPVTSMEEVLTAARKLLAEKIANIIVTLGDKGALYCSSSTVKHIRPYQVDAVDTTAAGDAYAGALAACLAGGNSLLESMDFAAAAAAVSVTRSGAQPSLPWREEVEAFLRKGR